MTAPLTGDRVLDHTRVLAGPHCTRMLCDMGAEVIKVEPPEGDITRASSPRINSIASYFAQQNAGKQCISIDLDKPEGRELLARLADHCDVLVENFRPGVLDRLGIGPDVLRARNPRLIVASISGYGQDGPWALRRAYASVVQAETGITHSQGEGRGTDDYSNDRHSHADVYTGIECASAVLAALYQRERTGVGDRIDVSMAQTMLYVNEHAHDALWDHEVAPYTVRSFGTQEFPVVAAANGERVVISGHPAENMTFDYYMRSIGRPELCAEARFATVHTRMEHIDEIQALIHEWAVTMADPEAIEAAMAANNLAVGRLRTVRDVCATDWADDRVAVVPVSDRGEGSIRVPNSPWRFAGSEVGLHGEPRFRGEDNRAVLSAVLGLDDTTIDRLEAEGVLTSRVPRR